MDVLNKESIKDRFMGKIVIQCPSCDNYVEAKKGFWVFGTKTKCACGQADNSGKFCS